MEEIKAGRFAVCKHPDHTDETDCGNRAIGCSKHCLCCMGEELAIELPEIKHTPGPWVWAGEDYRGGWGWQLLVGPSGEGIVCGESEDGVPYKHLQAFTPIAPKHCKTGLAADKDSAPAVHVRQADARLIAAAPEMLAMLQEIATSGEWYASALELNDLCGYDIEKKLLELIAKATSN